MSIIRDIFTSSVNSTLLSMHERFTYLQKNVRPVQTTLMTIRTNIAANQQASAKNRRLAMQMERRLSAMAALKIKKKSIRQRLGTPSAGAQGNNVRDRLTLPSRGRGRSRSRNVGKSNRLPRRGRNIRRSQSVQSLSGGSLQRSRSMQSLNNDKAVPHRSRSRSRSRSRARSRAPSVGPKETVARRRRAGSVLRQERFKKGNPKAFTQQTFTPQRRKRSDSVNFRNRRARTVGIEKDQRKTFLKRGGSFQNRGRGSFRGRGGRGQGQTTITRTIRVSRTSPAGPVPTKEELDKELEQYMANTKAQLDKDIDTYMKENENEEMDILG